MPLYRHVLETLRMNAGEQVQPAVIARLHSVTEPEVTAAIDELVEMGYELEAIPGVGVRLLKSPDRLYPEEIEPLLETEFLGRKLLCFSTVGSTNDIAQKLAAEGHPEGTVVVAESQTKGRGRLGRSWHSPAGVGIYFSMIFKPPSRAGWQENMPAFSLVASLAVADSIEKVTGSSVGTKWPNDCLIGGKKVCGILSQLGSEGQRLEYLICGIGVNVNHSQGDFPDQLRRATSLFLATGKKFRRAEVLAEIINRLERLYLDFVRSGFEGMRPAYLDRFILRGKKMSLLCGDQEVVGIAEDIDKHGFLVLRTDQGIRAFASGEVTTAGAA